MHEGDDTEGVVPVCGAPELLAALPPGRWAVVTSGTRYLATRRLSYAGLPAPAVLITADEVRNGKPHAEPYLKGAAVLGFAPEQCMVFEDAPAGIQAARAARMKVVGLTTTYSVEELSQADALVRDLSQVRVRAAGRDAALEIFVESARAARRQP
jgi:sugar-phosphatase